MNDGDNGDEGGLYRLYGPSASPYVAKMRALLRYRRIPFAWIPAALDWAPGHLETHPDMAGMRPALVPMLRYPDGTRRNDTTVLALDLEERHAERSLLPPDPAHRFLARLIEDMGDEWGMKAAFHYRWGNDADRIFTADLLAAEVLGLGRDGAAIREAGRQFRERQVDRMPFVGCTQENGPLLEETFRRMAGAVERLPGAAPFLFGSRPSLGDFGLFGALYTLWRDPTPAAIMARAWPASVWWVRSLDDGSGIEGEWLEEGADVPEATRRLLRLCGEIYLPFLAANEAAFEAGEEWLRLEAAGLPYAQATFRYQVKCLRWLRAEFAALPDDARRRVTPLLEETGCLAVL